MCPALHVRFVSAAARDTEKGGPRAALSAAAAAGCVARHSGRRQSSGSTSGAVSSSGLPGWSATSRT